MGWQWYPASSPAHLLIIRSITNGARHKLLFWSFCVFFIRIKIKFTLMTLNSLFSCAGGWPVNNGHSTGLIPASTTTTCVRLNSVIFSLLNSRSYSIYSVIMFSSSSNTRKIIVRRINIGHWAFTEWNPCLPLNDCVVHSLPPLQIAISLCFSIPIFLLFPRRSHCRVISILRSFCVQSLAYALHLATVLRSILCSFVYLDCTGGPQWVAT